VRYIYIASPYTGKSPDDHLPNVERSMDAAERLVKLGYLPFLPLLYHYWDERYPHSYDFWVYTSEQWIRKCDAVLRLAGTSKGADSEVACAKRLGIPVFYSIEELSNAPSPA